MRNLRIAAHVRRRLDLSDTDKNPSSTSIHAVTVDGSNEDDLFVATCSTPTKSHSLVDIDVWRISPGQNHLSSFAAPLYSDLPVGQQIVAFDFLADGGSFVDDEPALCLISAGGDISLTAYPAEDDKRSQASLPEIVGSVEQGVLAASWSPDQELLVLITAPTPAEKAEDGVSKRSTILLMTREFEVLSENVLQTDDFGEERPIALGWGSKATQFHGSEGKQVAAAAAAAEKQNQSFGSTESSRGHLLPADDGLPRISWRADSSIFVVSSTESSDAIRPLHNAAFRVIRTFSKNGNLLATSDPNLPGISQALAYRSTGILMATTQHCDGEHTVTFIERNGLKKSSFPLRHESPVFALKWNSDGSLLAVWSSQHIQIWSTSNYHWYVKQQITVEAKVTSILWHAENAELFYLSTTNGTSTYRFVSESCVSTSQCVPNDAACAAVVDGNRILLTPFRLQSIPPPMSSTQIILEDEQVPIDLNWASVALTSQESASLLLTLLPTGAVRIYVLEWGSLARRSSNLWQRPWLLCTIDFGLAARQVAGFAHRKGDFVKVAVGALAVEGFETLKLATRKVNWRSKSLGNTRFESLSLGKAQRRMLVAAPPLTVEDAARLGEVIVAQNVFVHEGNTLRNMSGDHIALNANVFRHLALISARPSRIRLVGLTESGQLFVNTTRIARNANSFTLTDTYVIWTDVAHQVHFLAVDRIDEENGMGDGLIAADENTLTLNRRVERGSRIVCAVPSSMTLILQMPRGNLEIISPRVLVLDAVRCNVEERRYGQAFRICRTHRLDMNILVDHDQERFLRDVEIFVRQVKDGEYLNLFLSSLSIQSGSLPMRSTSKANVRVVGSSALPSSSDTDVRRERINAICDAFRAVLEAMPNADDYINTILTTFVRRSPPDHEAALQLLGKLKKRDAALADEACKDVIFLTDADKLFDAALGTYDLTLPLLVAHHSPRKDPREYLPFLRELREVKPLEMQRFRIDETLQRWQKALGWLAAAEGASLDEVLAFVEKHELYADGLVLFKENPQWLRAVQDSFGDWLMEKQRYKEAAVVYAQCGEQRKTVEADVKAGHWREALVTAESAVKEGTTSKEELTKLAERVASSLITYGRFLEASTVTLEYAQDVEDAVRLLCRELEFGEAKRIACRHGRGEELCRSVVRPMVSESATTLLEEIAEVHDQGERQFDRLQELRIRKRERPEEYYPDIDGADGALDHANVDGASEAFTMFTRFTRFSAFTNNTQNRRSRQEGGLAGSTMSQFTMRTNAASQTAKARKKEMRKQGTGKKNSIYEEDYLFTSVSKLVGSRLEKVQRDTVKVVMQLVRLADVGGEADESAEEFKALAKEIAIRLDAAEETMNRKAEELWQGGLDDEEALEQARVGAIQEGLALGLSWAQLQANGLFAAPMHRDRVHVASVEWRQPAILPATNGEGVER